MQKSDFHVPRVWFVVPAAGIGTRMESELAKQYLPLQKSTILETTLTTLLSVKSVAGIVVAIHPDDRHWLSLDFSSHKKIHTVVGGNERSDSVMSALCFLQTQLEENDWVLVHDAARPCVRSDSIESMIRELNDNAVGGILAIPVSDTLKQVDDSHHIQKTVPRDMIFQAQTPQMFRYGVLHKALTQAIDSEIVITDEASAVEHLGLSPTIVVGRQDNIKITRPHDLSLAEMILDSQRNNQ